MKPLALRFVLISAAALAAVLLLSRPNAAPSPVATSLAPTVAPVSAAPVTVEHLAAKAAAGDARAAWHLSEELHACALAVALSEKGRPSAEADVCLAHPRDFSAWAAWRDKAIAAGDPVALLHEALQTDDPVKREAAIDAAARSHDAEAQVLLGHTLLSEPDPVDGLAWLIVGCGDCVLEDPRLGFAPCVASGDCPSNTRFTDYLAAVYGAATAADAQARAASLKELYR